jgi:hypothetical protein
VRDHTAKHLKTLDEDWDKKGKRDEWLARYEGLGLF